MKKKRLLVAKKLTNLLIYSLFLLIAHHPRKTAQAVENYCFPIRETKCSNAVFISEGAHITQEEKCYWDLEVTQHH